MSWIVLTRNPNSKVLSPISDNIKDEDFPPIMEYETDHEAEAAAMECAACVAWGWVVVEVPL